MIQRVLLAGLLGGIAMFVWGFVAHVVLPLYNDSFTVATKDDAIVSDLKSQLPGPGMYMVPTYDMHKKMTDEEKKAMDAKHAASPHALIVWKDATGEPPMDAKTLACQFVACVVTSLLLSLILWKGAGGASFIGKMWMSALIGVTAAVAIDGSYHIWYGFPHSYLVASILDHAASFFCAGVVAALVIRPKK
jgi:hypothetical protein